MPDSLLIDALIKRWEECRARGEERSTEDLCRDHPELVETLRSAITRLSVGPAATATAGMDAPTTPGDELDRTIESDDAVGIDAPRIVVRCFGDYELEQELARGGMGIVYRARQVPLKRTVALKMILAGQLASEDEVRRFHREAEAAADLVHPGIVPIHEVGEHGGQHYFSMAFVDGGSLANRVAAGPIPPREAARLVCEVAEAVHYAHTRGLIHRDLKPANILLDADGRPKVTDFGLAKRLGGDHSHLTASGQVMGTPSYMAPEQAAGQSDVGIAADVYGLGAVLYHLLTGRPPFQAASTVETLVLVRDRDPVTPRALNPGVPIDLETIALRCLQKSPAARYADAAAVAEDLRRFAEDRPIVARPINTVQRLKRWTHRHKVIASLMATIATLLAVGVVGLATAAVWFREEARIKAELARKSEGARRRADEAQIGTGEALRVAQTTLADTLASNGQVAGQRGDPARATLWYASATRVAEGDRVRRETNLASARSWGREMTAPVAAIPQHKGYFLTLEFQPGDGHLLTLNEDGSCLLWDWRREEPLSWLRPDLPACAVCWSPDGSRLVVGRPSGRLEIRALPSGDVVKELDLGAAVRTLAYSPDGLWLAIGSESSLRFWDHRKATLLERAWPHPGRVRTLTFSPRGDRLATLCADRMVRVFAIPPRDGPGGGPLFDPLPHLVLPERVGWQPAPAFVSGGRALLTITGQGELTAWDTDTGRPTRGGRIASEQEWLFGVGASHDGSMFVAAGTGSRLDGPQFWINRGEVVTSRRLEHHHYVTSLVFSRDDSVLLTASWDQRAKLWSLPSGEPLGNPLIHQGIVTRAAFSPSGRFVATAQFDGLVRVWRRPSGRPFDRKVPGQNVAVLSPDGRHVVASRYDYFFRPSDARELRVYETDTCQPAGPSLPLGGTLRQTALSPAGTIVAAGVAVGDSGRLAVFDFKTGKSPFAPMPLPGVPDAVAFSPDGAVIAVYCQGGHVLLFDAARGRETLRLRCDETNQAPDLGRRTTLFTPDGTCLVSLGGDAKVRAWDLSRGAQPLPRPEEDSVGDITLSHDGRFLATGKFAYDSNALALKVWDLRAGRPVSPAMIHPDGILAVRFSPDDRWVVTANRDGQARVWDWRAGRLVCPPMENEDEIFDAVITPDGRHCLTVGRPGFVRIWDIRLGKPVGPPIATDASRKNEDAYSVAITPDGRRAVVGTELEIDVIDLGDSHAAEGPDPGELERLAELATGYRVDTGNLARLTAQEWLGRWRELRSDASRAR